MPVMDNREPSQRRTISVEKWLDEAAVEKVEYSAYWNDESIERNKVTNVLGGDDFQRFEKHLDSLGFPDDLRTCVEAVRRLTGRGLAGMGIDTAAGNLWAVPHLFRLGTVEKLYCLEYSKHRLLKLGPRIIEHYGLPSDRIVLALGSFYDLHVPDESLDFALLSAAFHHADEPDRLLAELRRALRPGGAVIIIGEHRVTLLGGYIRNFMKALVSRFVPEGLQRRVLGRSVRRVQWFPAPSALFPVDPVLGDHLYTSAQYRRLFERHSFSIHDVTSTNRGMRSYVLFRR